MVFIEWLVGFTDGTFSIEKGEGDNKKQKFKKSQSTYNIRILRYIQFKLGYYSIAPQEGFTQQFRIRDKDILKNLIIPIFDCYPLRTSKLYDYGLFKEALFSFDLYYSLTLHHVLSIGIPEGYKSPLSTTFSKSWIIGFIEAEG